MNDHANFRLVYCGRGFIAMLMKEHVLVGPPRTRPQRYVRRGRAVLSATTSQLRTCLMRSIPMRIGMNRVYTDAYPAGGRVPWNAYGGRYPGLSSHTAVSSPFALPPYGVRRRSVRVADNVRNLRQQFDR